MKLKQDTTKVLNCGLHQLMRPQYCGCGRRRNSIGLQLQCELKSRVMPQRNGILTATDRNSTLYHKSRKKE
jgi:hypothetical protein